MAVPFLTKIWRAKDLRKKILLVLFLIVVFRLASNVAVPSEVSKDLVAALLKHGGGGDFFNVLDIFSGGALSRFSVVAMGVGPYITSSIIVQLLTKMVPQLKELSKEGEYGRGKINSYTRLLSIPVAVVQAVGYINLLKQTAAQVGVAPNFTAGDWFIMIVSLVAGTVFVMWLGELITEKGVGNGISLIIFVGIVSRFNIGNQIAQWTEQGAQSAFLFNLLILAIIVAIVVAAVVFVTEGERSIPVSYARALRGTRAYQSVQTNLPLKVNMGGVVPIIFALAVISVPGTIGSLFTSAHNELIRSFAHDLQRWFNPNGGIYWGIYFVLVVAFTYFTTYLYFHPKEVAEDIQKRGGYIPGIRPGQQTAEYLTMLLNRITVFGALFLGLVAVLPFLVQQHVRLEGLSNIAIGGTSLLIVVSVVIETIRQVQAQLILRAYDEY